MNQIDLYRECMRVINRHSDAYDYAMEQLNNDTANRMIYDMQPIAGWFPLSTLSVSHVLDIAVEPEWGQYKDFPEAEDIALEAAEYVGEHWEDGDNGAADWALEKFYEFAIERGIFPELQETEMANG